MLVLQPAKYEDLLERCLRHLRFCFRMYEKQRAAGRLFLHEHPATATSWKQPCMVRLSQLPGVERVKAHMCAHGMWASDAYGPGLVEKATDFLTNSAHVASLLNFHTSLKTTKKITTEQ